MVTNMVTVRVRVTGHRSWSSCIHLAHWIVRAAGFSHSEHLESSTTYVSAYQQHIYDKIKTGKIYWTNFTFWPARCKQTANVSWKTKLQNHIAKQNCKHCKTTLQNNITKQRLKTTSQNNIAKQHCKTKLQNNIAKVKIAKQHCKTTIFGFVKSVWGFFYNLSAPSTAPTASSFGSQTPPKTRFIILHQNPSISPELAFSRVPPSVSSRLCWGWQ